MTPDQRALFDRIATWLEAGAPHEDARGMCFSMADILLLRPREEGKDWCGTACCIAGAALTFGAPDWVAAAPRTTYSRLHNTEVIQNFDGVRYTTWDRATRMLGLTEEQAQMMFAPWENDHPDDVERNWPESPDNIDAAWAARTIRRYMEHGDIRWDLTKEA